MKQLLGGCLVVVLLVAVALGAMIGLAGAESPTADACAGDADDMSVKLAGKVPDEVAGFSGAALANAAIIIDVADKRGLGVTGAQIAISTAIVESGLRNLANAGQFTYPAGGSRVMTREQWDRTRVLLPLTIEMPNDGVAPGDWDSVGMFQGRLTAGWGGTGTVEEQLRRLLDPVYTTGRFFDAMVKIPDWRQRPPGQVAQKVQRSAFPDRYAKAWDTAGQIVAALAGVTVSAAAGDGCQTGVSTAEVSADGWTKPITEKYKLTSPYGMRRHPTLGITRLHAGQDFGAPAGTPIYAAASGVVVAAGRASSTGTLNWVVIDHGGGVQTAYLHSEDDGILVTVGQQVTAGQQIALVGSSGDSTGPHLHFEVHIDGKPIEPMAFLAAHGVTYGAQA